MALSRGSPRVAVNNHPALRSPDVPRRRPEAADATARSTRPSSVHATKPRSMDLGQALLLSPPAWLTGAVNAVAGGGSLMTFPALLGMGLPPIHASVTNSVSVCPGYLPASPAAALTWPGRGAAAADRADRRARVRRRGRAVAAHLGAGVQGRRADPGAGRDGRSRSRIDCAAWSAIRGRSAHAARGHSAGAWSSSVSVYGGYFGAALGVMYVAALALVLDEPLARVNALKNAVLGRGRADHGGDLPIFAPVDWVRRSRSRPPRSSAGTRRPDRPPAAGPPCSRAIIVAFGTTIGVLLLFRAFR